jgi:hypothetical protein
MQAVVGVIMNSNLNPFRHFASDNATVSILRDELATKFRPFVESHRGVPVPPIVAVLAPAVASV